MYPTQFYPEGFFAGPFFPPSGVAPSVEITVEGAPLFAIIPAMPQRAIVQGRIGVAGLHGGVAEVVAGWNDDEEAALAALLYLHFE